jgi:hypothetical protein
MLTCNGVIAFLVRVLHDPAARPVEPLAHVAGDVPDGRPSTACSDLNERYQDRGRAVKIPAPWRATRGHLNAWSDGTADRGVRVRMAREKAIGCGVSSSPS